MGDCGCFADILQAHIWFRQIWGTRLFLKTQIDAGLEFGERGWGGVSGVEGFFPVDQREFVPGELMLARAEVFFLSTPEAPACSRAGELPSAPDFPRLRFGLVSDGAETRRDAEGPCRL